MQKFILALELYAPAVLRYGMAVVIVWFGIAQFMDPNKFVAYVPDSVVTLSGLSAATLVYCNALFELVFGLLMLFGIQTRISALLLSLHLFDIMYVVGYGEIGVRDLGLAVATLVVFMNGADILTFEQKKITNII